MKKRLVILGAGKSGIGAAVLGKQKGYEVFVSDHGKIAQACKDVLIKQEIDWEENQHSADQLLAADLVIKSPGIPDTVEIIKKCTQQCIAVISEIEFAARFTQANIVAVTGSNGKTTVVNWIASIFENAGLDYVMAGNMGYSFAESVAQDHQPEYYVLEVSSFQLDGIVNFHPHIAVLTNITPDHLDRYEFDFQKYIDAKFRITENQNGKDFFIYDADNKVIEEQIQAKTIQATKIPLSFNALKKEGTETINKMMSTKVKNRTFAMSTKDLALKGRHNTKNAMAASTVSNLLKIRKQTIRESLGRFQGVEHRLEDVLKVKNVQYINDSKATNINSTFYALKTVKPKTVWIVGGEDKGNNYEELLPLVNEKIKAIICLGIDNAKLIKSFDNCVDTLIETTSMQEAVGRAYQIAEEGDTVLLSPACASFDLFKNFEDRGRQFKEAVRKL